mmetsp:Transcript_64984/g.171941  ORF Transcript_64984/g.171941 Transcript_64984/m.171941 type:complete len:223 (+) Transcript_64984:421-1089(+)
MFTAFVVNLLHKLTMQFVKDATHHDLLFLVHGIGSLGNLADLLLQICLNLLNEGRHCGNVSHIRFVQVVEELGHLRRRSSVQFLNGATQVFEGVVHGDVQVIVSRFRAIGHETHLILHPPFQLCQLAPGMFHVLDGPMKEPALIRHVFELLICATFDHLGHFCRQAPDVDLLGQVQRTFGELSVNGLDGPTQRLIKLSTGTTFIIHIGSDLRNPLCEEPLGL